MEAEQVIEGPGNFIFLFTLIALAVAMAWESMAPRRDLQQNLAHRWLNNFSLSLLTWYVTALAGTAVVLWLARWTEIRQFGLFQHVAVHPAIVFFCLLAFSQFLSYLVHIAFHRVSWLWPLHAIHHSDIDVDVSTSYRHHPLEPLVSMPFMIPIILLLGIPLEVAAAYRLFEVVGTLFSHSNVRVPQRLEKYLRWIILTPDFHRLHHCSESRFTNSNYGSLLPWFDYLFGTASSRPFDEQESMELGLEYLRQPRDGRLDQLLVAPLRIPAEIANRVTAESKR